MALKKTKIKKAVDEALREVASREWVGEMILSDLTREIFDDLEDKGAEGLVRAFTPGVTCAEWKSTEADFGACTHIELYDMTPEPVPGYYLWMTKEVEGKAKADFDDERLVDSLQDHGIERDFAEEAIDMSYPGKSSQTVPVKATYEVWANIPRYMAASLNG